MKNGPKLFGKEIRWTDNFRMGLVSRFPFDASFLKLRHAGESVGYRISVKLRGSSIPFIEKSIKEEYLEKECEEIDIKCKEFMQDVKWWFE